MPRIKEEGIIGPDHKVTTVYRKAVYPGEESWCVQLCNWICNLIFSVMMGIGLYYLWNMLGRPNGKDALDFLRDLNVSDFSNVLDNITESVWDNGFDEDPYVGDNTTQIWKRATASGLTLVLQNALDDDWQTEFEIAVEEWQESEVLELTAMRVDVDNTCQRVQGLMKVCNGNFGETGWLGINEIEMEYSSGSSVGYIVSSVAKMNEYYLNHADYEQRQYTMCHEIGHGFGLPHTDENFNNQDQGNCLDYTNTPENNLHPGDVNMNRLKSIYGWTEDDDYLLADDAVAVDAYDDDDAAAVARDYNNDDYADWDDYYAAMTAEGGDDDAAVQQQEGYYNDDGNMGRRRNLLPQQQPNRHRRRRIMIRYLPVPPELVAATKGSSNH